MNKGNATGQKKSRKALSAPDLSMKTVLDNSCEAVLIADGEGTLVYGNQKASEITGYEMQELLGRNYRNMGFFPKKVLDYVNTFFIQNLKGQSTGPSQIELKRKDGAKIWIEFQANPIKQDGNVFVTGCFRDISERKQAEKALKESREFSTNLLDNAPNPVILINPDSSIEYVNAAFEKLTGFSQADIAGKRIPYPWWPDEYRDEISASLKETIARGGRKKERIFRKKNGDDFWVETQSAPVMLNRAMRYFLVDWTDITERKQVEKALRDSEEKFRNLFENGKDAVILADAQTGILIDVNPAGCRLLGLPKERIVGRHQSQIHPPELAEKFKKAFHEHVEKGLVVGEDTVIQRNDGSQVQCEITASVAKFGDKYIIQGVFRDVTERKQAEEALWESQEFNTNLLEKAPNQVVVINPDTSIKYVNSSWEKLNGWTKKEVVGLKVPYPWWPEEMAEAFLPGFQEVMKGGDGKGEVVARKKNGELYWLAMNWTPVKRNGELMYLLINSVDITEQKKAEEALKERERQYRELADSITDIFFAMDKELRYTYWNMASEKLTGISSENALGKNIYDVFPDTAETRRAEVFYREVFKTKTPRIFLNNYTLGGKAYIFEISAYPSAEGIAVFCRDITERKQMEDELREHRDNLEELVLERTNELSDANRKLKHELEEREKIEQQLRKAKNDAETANRAKSEFLALTSHEIRTPIHGVMGMINLVLDSQLEQDQRQYLKMAMASAESLLNIINDILDLSKIEVGQTDAERADFDLRATFEDTLDTMAVAAFKKGLEFTSRIPHDLPTALVGDEGRLRQVLVNLIGNANKFTEHGEIALSVEPVEVTDKEVEFQFSVRDTGIGIPADKQGIIFEPFQQADGSINRRYGGTGLGLTISQRLIANMGGRIWVESVPGEGSTFHFTGRFARQPAEKQGNKPPEMPPELRAMPVLLVDDNASSRKVLRELLSSWGIQVSEAESGPAALKELEEAREASRSFRLVFIDKNMPVMNGFQVAAEIMHNTPAPPIIVMMLPPDSISNDFHRCQELGIANYTVKPIRESRLYEAILKANGMATESHAESGRVIHIAKGLHLHILVAEDNATSQLIARKTLEKMGHTVEIAANGLEATRLLEQNGYDLVLMDAEMPVMNGLEATRYIRRQEKDSGRHIPIVAMTAYAMKEDRNKCLEVGMDGYLSKPAKPDDINNLLNELFAKEAKTAPPPAIDMDAAMKVFGGDNELMKEAAGIFLEEDYPEQIEIIKDGISRQDAPTVKAAAHSVKGAARSLGGLVLGDVALRLEEAGRNGDLTNAKELVDEMEIEVKRLTDFFQEKRES